jgi:ankyrin repeat protein
MVKSVSRQIPVLRYLERVLQESPSSLSKRLYQIILDWIAAVRDMPVTCRVFVRSFDAPPSAFATWEKSKQRDTVRYKPWSDLNDAAAFGKNWKGYRLEQVLKHCDVNTKDVDQSTPLHAAALKGNLGAAMLLLGKGADVHAREMRNQTPLHFAARNGHDDLISLLVRAGADINAVDDGGKTALRCAAKRGHTKAVHTLAMLGARVNVLDSKKRNPYFCAMLQGQKRAACLLNEYGADTAIFDSDGRKASEVAGRAGYLNWLRYSLTTAKPLGHISQPTLSSKVSQRLCQRLKIV